MEKSKWDVKINLIHQKAPKLQKEEDEEGRRRGGEGQEEEEEKGKRKKKKPQPKSYLYKNRDALIG